MSRIYLSPPDISQSDYKSLETVLESNWVAPVGPELDLFEKEVSDLVGVEHAVALNSGTAALHMALMVLGVGSGDRVVCPTFTFAASANPVCYLGAEPVFVDSEESSWNMDPDLLERALQQEQNVKAVIIVHLYGQCARMDEIVAVCRRHNVPIVEDAAEALGATYRGKAAGSFGDLAFFSFNGNKIITTSAGGMLLSSNEEWIEQAHYLATQAREPVLHYEHRAVGYNYRMSNVLAALGRGQLADLPRRIAARKAHFEAYSKSLSAFQGVVMMPIQDSDSNNYWLSCLTVDSLNAGISRDDILMALAEEDIEARPVWKPLHLQPVFSDKKIHGGEVAERIFERGVCLPSGSSLTEVQRDRVIGALSRLLSSTD
ncbi:MAG: DegT/DnrJ/EryC1/StrS family aminotransferase [Lentimonas sp.]